MSSRTGIGQLPQFEQVIESRSATPEPRPEPGNDTDVIRHGLAAPVKRWKAFSYHLVIKLRRVGYLACRSQHPPGSPSTPPERLLSVDVKVTVLVGGVGGARFLL